MKKLVSLLICLALLCTCALAVSETELSEMIAQAEGGDAEAVFSLGCIYDDLHDEAQAVYWYEKAAETGDVTAMVNMADLYLDEQSPVRDYEKAYLWYEKASEAGSAYAMYELGYIYENGLSVEKDVAQARVWYENAINTESGSALAEMALEALDAA